MLDAILAMVLTLATLATIATVVMEACLRTSRMRKKNLAQVMQLLNKELDIGPLGLDPEERKTFIQGVIRNPACGISDVLSKKFQDSSPEELLKFIGYDHDSGKNLFLNAIRHIGIFIRQIFGDAKRSGLYDSVTMEHVLRRLVEIESVQSRSRNDKWSLKVELNRLARKYEEYGSGVSANFKRHAQAWSIAVGVVLALVANIDGLRVFEAYLGDKALAQKIIAQQEAMQKNYEAASGRQKEFQEAVNLLETAQKEMQAAVAAKGEQDNVAAKAKLQKAEEMLEKLATPEMIKKELESVSQQLDNLKTLGVPLGWRFYPNCPYGESAERWKVSDKKCQVLRITNQNSTKNLAEFEKTNYIFTSVLATAKLDFGGFIRWLFAVVVTGLLIGLGAPFWFDVAKRLARVRSGVRDAASTEIRMSANNADGDEKKRKVIVNNVVSDAAGELGENGQPGELARAVADAEINKQKI